MKFSASRLKTWQDCQAKGKFKYIDLLPDGPRNAKTTFGSVIHKVLEEHTQHRDDELAIKQFKDWWQNPEKLGLDYEVWPKFTTYGGLRERGIQLLRTHFDSLKWDNREIIATEQAFTVPFGRHELNGYIDLLEIRKSGKGKDLLRIVDYKTNSRPPLKSQLYLDIQFTVYVYATLQPEFWDQVVDGKRFYEETKDLHRRPIWFQLMDAKEIDAGSRDQDDFERLYRLCDAIEQAHEKEVFVPRIGEACEWCPYKEPCGVRVPTQPEVMDQEGAWI